jgi:hypothetical protein
MTRTTPKHAGTVTTHEVAVALKVSEGSVRRWLAQGRVTGERVNGRWEIPATVLEMLLTRERQARAWRATDETHTKASVRRTSATARLVAAAIRWRANPDDPQAATDLENAVDDRVLLSVKTSPGPQPN